MFCLSVAEGVAFYPTFSPEKSLTTPIIHTENNVSARFDEIPFSCQYSMNTSIFIL